MPNHPTDEQIRKALVSLELARSWLFDLERDPPPSQGWKATSRHESELARARRELALSEVALRGARLRALNERLERLRRPPGPPVQPPKMLSLFGD